MARTGVSYEEIEHVANQLYQQGINPTVQRVRQELGTGSNTTIARHLKTWQETFFSEDSTRVPMAIPDEVAASVDGFWAAAVAKADENYQAYREEIEQQRDVALAEKDSALLLLSETQQENQRLDAELAQVNEVNQTLSKDLSHLTGQYDELQNLLKKSEQVALDAKVLTESTLQEATQTREAFELQIAALQQQHEASVAALTNQYELELNRHESTENQLLVKLDDHRHQLDEAHQRLATIEAESLGQKKTVESQYQQFERKIHQLESQQSDTQDAWQQALQEKEALQAEIKTLVLNYQQHAADYEKLLNTLVESNANHVALQDSFNTLNTTITDALLSKGKQNKDDPT